jgi:hypothetical protein
MVCVRADIVDRLNKSSFSTLDADVGTIFKAGALFTARGFSHSTIKALVLAGIDAPERLLFVDGANLLSISGLDEEAFKEIARYRSQFKQGGAPSILQQPSERSPLRLRQREHRGDCALTQKIAR